MGSVDYRPLVKWSVLMGLAVTFIGVVGLILAGANDWADVTPLSFVQVFMTGMCGWLGVPMAVFIMGGGRKARAAKKGAQR